MKKTKTIFNHKKRAHSSKLTLMIPITPEDVKELKQVINSITKTLTEHRKVDYKLGLSDKFLGPLGEAKGLIKILQNQAGTCQWYGKITEDFDLKIEENGNPVRYQKNLHLTKTTSSLGFRSPIR